MSENADQGVVSILTFSDPDFGQDVFNQFNSLREDGVLCDFTAVAQKKSFNLHRLVIVSVSDYFRDLIIDNQDGPQNTAEFDDLDPDAFRKIVFYMYSGKLSIDIEEMDNIYLCATTLKLMELTRWCLSMMSKNVTLDTCIELRNSAEDYNIKHLREECETFMAKNFLDICNKDRFFTLSLESFNSLLQHEELKTDSELKVYVTFRKWLEKNEKLKDEVIPLMDSIKFGFLSIEDNNSILKDDVLQDDGKARYVQDAIAYLQCDSALKHKLAGTFSTPRTAPSLLIMGGMDKDEKYLDTVCQVSMTKDAITKKSTKFTKLPAPRFLPGVVTWHNFVYVMGGKESTEKITRTTFCLNPIEKTWLTLANMKLSTCKAAAFVLDGVIYVAGGYDGEDKLRNVQRYTIKDDKWKKMRSLPYAISGAAAAVLNGIGYVSGGQFDGGNKSRDLLAYIPETDSWRKKAQMTEPRRSHTIVPCNDHLIIIGGLPMTNVVEIYDPQEDQFSTLCDIPYFRRHTIGLWHKNFIYICAGLGTSRKSHARPTETDTILSYDVEKNQWRETITSIPYATYGCGCALARLPVYGK